MCCSIFHKNDVATEHSKCCAHTSTNILCAAVVTTNSALAQKKYDPGVTDTEIKIGNIMPYSGPASAYGMNGKVQAAYFKKINDEGGIQWPKNQLHFL